MSKTPVKFKLGTDTVVNKYSEQQRKGNESKITFYPLHINESRINRTIR